MTTKELDTTSEELREKLEEILMFVCHTGSMAQAGKTINPKMFSEQGDEIMQLIRQHTQAAYALGLEDALFVPEKHTDSEIAERNRRLGSKGHSLDDFVLNAKITENKMYLTQTTRHYFPAGVNDPHIPVAQFNERIEELEKEGST
jgi:hypothetical protein